MAAFGWQTSGADSSTNKSLTSTNESELSDTDIEDRVLWVSCGGFFKINVICI